MLSLDTNTKSTKPLIHNFESSDEKLCLSFSELLKGASLKADSKNITNGKEPLPLDGLDDAANTSQNISNKDSIKEFLLLDSASNKLTINPKITKDITPKELKSLLIDAKKYLKSQIIQSDGYKKSEINTLPKNIKGLSVLAKKFDFDISKITVEEVQTLAKEVKTPQQIILKAASIFSTNEALNKNDKIKPLELMLKEKSTSQGEVQKKDIKVTSQNEIQVKGIKPISQNEMDMKMLHKNDIALKIQTIIPSVSDKKNTSDYKIDKTKGSNNLSSLLQLGKNSVNLTSDFPLASVIAIAPNAKTESISALEKLLFTEQGENSTTPSKTDGLQSSKIDSFEVKLNEAKQMMRYISQDVKTAIEDYKSPFTKIKVQLNPQKLGEVDLTVVQRGKNLHVNISSNNAAINTLAMNVNELRAQLNSSGINNATLNFNNTQNDNANSNSSQHNQSQNREQTKHEYNYFESEEQNEEILSSLEIVVPSYA